MRLAAKSSREDAVTYMQNQTISPSLLKDMSDCEREAMLYRMRGMDKYDPAHADFGSAFGAAAAYIAMHPDEPRKMALGGAYACASVHFKLLQSFGSKDFGTLIQCIDTFYDIWMRDYATEWVGYATETRILIEVVCLDGFSYVLGGAYDLEATRLVVSEDGSTVLGVEGRIFDFKAVASEYMYNWGTDPQIMHYSLLRYITREVLQDGTPEINGLGCYFVGVITGEGVVMHQRYNTKGAWRMVQSHLHRCRETARRLAQAGDELEILGEAHCLEANGRRCEGRYKCKHHDKCYGGEAFTFRPGADTRTFNKIVRLQITEEMLFDLAKRFAEGLGETETIEAAVLSAEVEALLNGDNDDGLALLTSDNSSLSLFID